MGGPVEPMHLGGHRAQAVMRHADAIAALTGTQVIAIMVNRNGAVDWVLPNEHVQVLQAILAEFVKQASPR